jgi:hypothetical protein
MQPAATVTQAVVTAVIVATMLYFPAGALLAVALTPFGVSPQALATFGNRLDLFPGLLAWWLIVLVPVLVYAAFVYPWPDKH